VTQKAAYIGFGSNSGDRVGAINTALEKLMVLEKTRLTDVSCLYETSPVGVKGGPFLNAVARIETRLEPRKLLEALLGMETSMGRIRKHEGWEPRGIDLDLLLYEDITINEKYFILPHPRMLCRRFVMEPLAEITPNLTVPPKGINVREAALELIKTHPEQEIKRLGTLQELKESLMFDV